MLKIVSLQEDFLYKRLKEKKEQNAFRSLKLPDAKIDFCSNDYLGIITNNILQPYLSSELKHGSGGSRLLAGNYALIEETEKTIADFHDAAAGLMFNSGYDANAGLLSSVPQKGDTILYDRLSHASLRDGIRLSFAESYSFAHNNIEELEKKLQTCKGTSFVITESVFSMDGDIAPLTGIIALCEKYNSNLIVDEAHATGVIGEKGEGLIQQLNLQQKCFARVHTFGKACGAHGAIVLGSKTLKDYLINFSRQFIYTTALPEASITAIQASYKVFPFLTNERTHIQRLATLFCQSMANGQQSKVNSQQSTVNSQRSMVNGQQSNNNNQQSTPIQVIIIPGNKECKAMAEKLQQNNLDVRPILYPTVPEGSERLRIVLHSFNTADEVQELMALLNSS